MDATRISDNKQVYLKLVRSSSDELSLLRLLSSAPYREDPRNPCVPILEIFPDPRDDSTTYVVMPLLRMIDRPPFAIVQDVLDFVDQMLNVGDRSSTSLWRIVSDTVLQGLRFLDELGIAHRYVHSVTGY